MATLHQLDIVSPYVDKGLMQVVFRESFSGLIMSTLFEQPHHVLMTGLFAFIIGLDSTANVILNGLP